jgi:hypothetical protein
MGSHDAVFGGLAVESVPSGIKLDGAAPHVFPRGKGVPYSLKKGVIGVVVLSGERFIGRISVASGGRLSLEEIHHLGEIRRVKERGFAFVLSPFFDKGVHMLLHLVPEFGKAGCIGVGIQIITDVTPHAGKLPV